MELGQKAWFRVRAIDRIPEYDRNTWKTEVKILCFYGDSH